MNANTHFLKEVCSVETSPTGSFTIKGWNMSMRFVFPSWLSGNEALQLMGGVGHERVHSAPHLRQSGSATGFLTRSAK